CADVRSIENKIRQKSPIDLEGYQQFLAYSEKVFHEGYEKLVHVPFLSLWNMFSVAPQLIQLQAFRSVYSMVSKYIRDEHLRQLFTFHSLLLCAIPFTPPSF